MTPTGPRLDAIVSVNVGLMTITVGAVLVDGFWQTLPNPTFRRWTTPTAAKVPWQTQGASQLAWWPVLPGKGN
jgi:hypothetical protein